MKENQTITLHKDIRIKKSHQITFGDLLKLMQEEMEGYDKLGRLDELMNQKMIVHINDLEGQVVQGYITDLIGWLKNGDVLITSNLEDMLFIESK